MAASISVLGVGLLGDGFFADLDAMEARAAASASLLVSGPQAARLDAVCDVAGVRIDRELVSRGSTFSARRERVSIARTDVDAIVRGLRIVAAAQATTRARSEWTATADLLTAAVAS